MKNQLQLKIDDCEKKIADLKAQTFTGKEECEARDGLITNYELCISEWRKLLNDNRYFKY